MSSETSFFDPIKCEIVDSFVRYTKLKGTKGKGEAWLYLGRDLDLLFFQTFFSNVVFLFIALWHKMNGSKHLFES